MGEVLFEGEASLGPCDRYRVQVLQEGLRRELYLHKLAPWSPAIAERDPWFREVESELLVLSAGDASDREGLAELGAVLAGGFEVLTAADNTRRAASE